MNEAAGKVEEGGSKKIGVSRVCLLVWPNGDAGAVSYRTSHCNRGFLTFSGLLGLCGKKPHLLTTPSRRSDFV